MKSGMLVSDSVESTPWTAWRSVVVACRRATNNGSNGSTTGMPTSAMSVDLKRSLIDRNACTSALVSGRKARMSSSCSIPRDIHAEAMVISTVATTTAQETLGRTSQRAKRSMRVMRVTPGGRGQRGVGTMHGRFSSAAPVLPGCTIRAASRLLRARAPGRHGARLHPDDPSTGQPRARPPWSSSFVSRPDASAIASRHAADPAIDRAKSPRTPRHVPATITCANAPPT